MILDTTFIIDVLRGSGRVLEWEEKFDKGKEEPLVSAITVMELWEGALRSEKTKEELGKMEELLKGLSSINFDPEDGKTSGELRASLAEGGTPIDVEDIMIGATALNSNQKVLTRNPEHFERIEGLSVETY